MVVKTSLFFLLKSQYQSLQNDISATFYVTIVSGESHKNNFNISFRVILPVSPKTALCLVLMENAKYIVCRFRGLNRNSIGYPKFANCQGKTNKRRTPWHSET